MLFESPSLIIVITKSILLQKKQIASDSTRLLATMVSSLGNLFLSRNYMHLLIKNVVVTEMTETLKNTTTGIPTFFKFIFFLILLSIFFKSFISLFYLF